MSAVSEVETVRLDLDGLTRFAVGALQDLGFSPEDAEIGADALVRTDLRGVKTHGLYTLPLMAPGMRGGGIRTGAKPHIVRETAGTAVLDGDGGMGHIVVVKATEIAARKARDVGSATVVVRNGNFCGAVGYYALKLAEQGLIGIVASNVPAGVAPPGSAAPGSIGNQPIAYAVPDPDGLGPIVLDIALSTGAGTKISQAAKRGSSIPEGWLVDQEGRPVTDPKLMGAGRTALTPVGGHKGYGLAVLVEIMAAVLAGGAMLREVGIYLMEPFDKPTGTGQWVTAFDPEAFMPMDEFKARLTRMRQAIHAAPKAVGSQRVMLPGEPEVDAEADGRANGIEFEQIIWEPLLKLAEELGRGDELLQTRR